MDGAKLAERIRFFQVLRLGRRQSGAFRCAGDGVSFTRRTGLRGRIPFLCRMIRRMAHKKYPLSASNAFRMTRQGDFYAIPCSNQRAVSAKRRRGLGTRPQAGGLGDEIPHRSPYREAMKKKESGSEAIPDGRLTHGWVLLGSVGVGVRQGCRSGKLA